MYAAMLSKRLTPPSSRRNFLIASAVGVGALVIGCAFGEGAHAEEAANGSKAGAGPKAPPTPDAFIRIAPDGDSTYQAPRHGARRHHGAHDNRRRGVGCGLVANARGIRAG